jgi:hypothetical protein
MGALHLRCAVARDGISAWFVAEDNGQPLALSVDQAVFGE